MHKSLVNAFQGSLIVGMFFLPALGFSAHPNVMDSRVPPGQLEEARALVSPFPSSLKRRDLGKQIYEGKGTCFNCHGRNGQGDGPVGAMLTPPPRNFRHPAMWHHRTEGELFWVIKHGSPGTGMIGFGGMLSDEEIWSVLQYAQTFEAGRGRRGSGFGEGVPGRSGPGHGKGGHGMDGLEHQYKGKGIDKCCMGQE